MIIGHKSARGGVKHDSVVNRTLEAGVDYTVGLSLKGLTVGEAALSLRGVNVADYAFSGFSYDPVSFTVTWTLNSAIGPDRLMVDLADSVTDQSGLKYETRLSLL